MAYGVLSQVTPVWWLVVICIILSFSRTNFLLAQAKLMLICGALMNCFSIWIFFPLVSQTAGFLPSIYQLSISESGLPIQLH